MSDKTKLVAWIRKFRNPAQRKLVRCSNNQYWGAHHAIMDGRLSSLGASDIADVLLGGPHHYALKKGGKYQSHLIAEAIIDYEKQLGSSRKKLVEVVGSAAALFQAQQNSTRDNDNPHRGALWGNKLDPEIRAKMTGGRANDTQVGGQHYKRQRIQHWDYVIANDIPYMEAQIIKYVSRWRNKNGLQDLEKALHFLQKLLEVEACTSAPDAKPCDCHSDDVNNVEESNTTTCQAEKISTED